MTQPLGIAAEAPRTQRMAGRNGWQRWRAWFRAAPAALPTVLLLLALSSLFLFGHQREYFYRDGHHDYTSSQTLTFAENLSLRHNLLIFRHQSWDAAGNRSYPSPYSRFPLGGYVLVKLAILPFGDTDFRAKIYAGRMLMLLLFSAAAVLAYLSLARIVGNRWDALTATLLAFSSYYALYYADTISNEVTIDLFAVMLAFHGMVIFVQEGRFRQLLVKSGLALLLGWHVYAFLLPFIVFGLAKELLQAHSMILPSRMLCNIKRYAATLFRSRYLMLGSAALILGIAILAFNFGNEYFALNGEVSFRELPSVDSLLKRTGGNERLNAYIVDTLHSGAFFYDQFYRIGQLMLPYAVNPYPVKDGFGNLRVIEYPVIVLGILALGVGLAGLAGARAGGRGYRAGMRQLLGTLAVAGFCWALPLRANVVFHDFESVFYIGIPLTAFALTLLYLRRLCRVRLSPLFAVAALAGFVFSASALAGVGQSGAPLAVEAEEMADYAAIRRLVNDRAAIYVPWRPQNIASGGATWAASYFLAGKTLIYRYDSAAARRDGQGGRDYLLLPSREDSPALLTPDNRHIFLYDYALYDDWYRTANLGRLIIAGDWNVYLRDGRLVYESSDCANRDARFFLHFVPADAAVLPVGRRGDGYDNHDFHFERWPKKYSLPGRCIIERALPEYEIIAIRTGQYTETGHIWGSEYRLRQR